MSPGENWIKEKDSLCNYFFESDVKIYFVVLKNVTEVLCFYLNRWHII